MVTEPAVEALGQTDKVTVERVVGHLFNKAFAYRTN